MLKTIAIVDPSSYSLPYDYFYIRELSKYYIVHFYYSRTSSNYEYIEKLRLNRNVLLFEYDISPGTVSRLKGLFNYFRLLWKIVRRRHSYVRIHFIWCIFVITEIPLFLYLRKKCIFTVHNDIPHGFTKVRYFPYVLIKKIVPTLVFVSQYTRNRFFSRYGEHSNSHMVQHGLMPFDDETNVEVNPVKQTATRKLVFWGRVEDYKGVDLFDCIDLEFPIDIYGRWSKDLYRLKNRVLAKSNINVVDSYLSVDELINLFKRDAIYILPYKDATQSGVLYTLLAYEKVFVSSKVGENYQFLLENDLEALSFDRDDLESINRSIEYALSNYSEIKTKLRKVRSLYTWDSILTEPIINNIYE